MNPFDNFDSKLLILQLSPLSVDSLTVLQGRIASVSVEHLRILGCFSKPVVISILVV